MWAILGAVVNHLLAGRRERINREVAFRTRQLEELYGPLLSLRNEIRAHSNLRMKLEGAVAKPYANGEDLEPVLKNIKDANETFWQLLMPRYHKMVEIFQDKMWLADPETREYFPQLVEFVFWMIACPARPHRSLGTRNKT